MDMIGQIDWRAMFVPTHSLLEMFVRGTIMYLALFLIFRFLARRQFGQLGLSDLLVIVIVADASQNAFSNEYKSIPEGIALVLTIVFWDFALDWVGYRVPALARLTQPPPLLLVRNGRVQRRNMKTEMITKEELMSHLREHGVDDLAQVKTAFMEGDGHVSVVKNDATSTES